MYFERLREHAKGYPGAWEDHPWGPESTVFKNGAGRVFVFCGEGEDGVLQATVKLAPGEGQEALALPFVSVARYVGRYGWVTARVTNEFEYEVLEGWVGRSFDLIGGRGARRRARRRSA